MAKDFKEFIRLSGMSHVRISSYYPKSNRRIERWHQTLKGDAVRPAQPGTLEEARQVGLAPILVRDVFRLVAEINRAGISILMVE